MRHEREGEIKIVGKAGVKRPFKKKLKAKQRKRCFYNFYRLGHTPNPFITTSQKSFGRADELGASRF
jgi:hypothetical protein